MYEDCLSKALPTHWKRNLKLMSHTVVFVVSYYTDHRTPINEGLSSIFPSDACGKLQNGTMPGMGHHHDDHGRHCHSDDIHVELIVMPPQ